MKCKQPFSKLVASGFIFALLASTPSYASWTSIIRPALRGGSLSLQQIATASGAASAVVVSSIIKSTLQGAAIAGANGAKLTDAQIQKAFYDQMSDFVQDSDGIIWTKSDLEGLISQLVAEGSMCGRAACQNILGVSPSNPTAALEKLTLQLERKVETTDDLIVKMSDQISKIDPESEQYLALRAKVDELRLQNSETSTALVKLRGSAADDFDWIVEMLNTCRYD